MGPEVTHRNRDAIHCDGNLAVKDQSKKSDGENKRGESQIHAPMLLLIGQGLKTIAVTGEVGPATVAESSQLGVAKGSYAGPSVGSLVDSL